MIKAAADRFLTWLASRSLLAYLTLLVTSALLLRLLWVALVRPIPTSDAAVYDTLAAGLAGGMGYVDSLSNLVPTAYRPPGYPMFLALLYAVFGRHHWAVGSAQAILGTLSCLLTYRLGARLLGECQGRLAGLALAAYPNQIYYTSLIMGESLFVALMLLTLNLLARQPPFRARHLLAAGVLAGLSALVRPSALLLWLFAGVWLPASESRGRRASSVLVFLVSLAAAISPWTVRNALVMKAPILISTNGGVNFYIGNNEAATGSYHFPPGNPLRAIHSEVERNAEGYRLGLEFVRSHPVGAGLLMPRKILSLLACDLHGLRWALGVTRLRAAPPAIIVLAAVASLAYLLVLILGVVGMVKLGFRSRESVLLSLVPICWGVTHIILFGAPRFHFPLIPIFLVFAAGLMGVPRREPNGGASRVWIGSPGGIRTRDLVAENHASWTTRRRGHVAA